MKMYLMMILSAICLISAPSFAAGNVSFTQTVESTDNLYGDYSEIDSSYLRSTFSGEFNSGGFSASSKLTYFNVVEYNDNSYFEIEVNPELLLGGTPTMLFLLEGYADSVFYSMTDGSDYSEYGIKVGLNADDLKSRNLDVYVGFCGYDNYEDVFDRTYIQGEANGTVYIGLVSNISAMAEYKLTNWSEFNSTYFGGMGLTVEKRDRTSSSELSLALNAELYLSNYLMIRPGVEYSVSRGDGDLVPYLSTEMNESDGEDSALYSIGLGVFLFNGNWSLFAGTEYFNKEYDSRLASVDLAETMDEAIRIERLWTGVELQYYLSNTVSFSGGWNKYKNDSNDYFINGESESIALSVTLTL